MKHYVQWTKDGDTWVVAFDTAEAAINAVERANSCKDWDGDTPLTGIYLGE